MHRIAADDWLNARTAPLVVAMLLFSVVGAYPQSNPVAAGATRPARSTLAPAPSIDERRLALDRDRLDFEKQKSVLDAKVEEERLEHEQTTARWSAVSSTLPFVAALFTLGYSVWSFRRQATDAARFQNESAHLQFEIKAAEIAFAGKTPRAVENRGAVLKKMFGNRLPENFPAHLDASAHGGGKESPAEKIMFLELLLKYPDKKAEIVELWAALFSDGWLDRVKPIVINDPGHGAVPG